jgi:hypothetical protein
VEDRIETWETWGQRPEEGNVVAAILPGALSNKNFKREILKPFPQAWPHKVMPNPRHGGDHKGE